jgi:hypothetical protein
VLLKNWLVKERNEVDREELCCSSKIDDNKDEDKEEKRVLFVL